MLHSGGQTQNRDVIQLVVLMGVILLNGGCATEKSGPVSTDPGTSSRETPAPSILPGPLAGHKRFAIFPLSFSVYETSAGEVTEKIPEWSEQAQKHLLQALVAEWGAHTDLKAETFSVDHLAPEQRDQVRDKQALFLAVSHSVGLHIHSIGPAHFPERRFQDYTFGADLAALAPDADAVIFLTGVDQISSGGRIAKQVVGTILLAALGVIATPGGGITAGSIGVVEVKTGKLLWWNAMARRSQMDTREPEGAAALVKELTQGLPWP